MRGTGFTCDQCGNSAMGTDDAAPFGWVVVSQPRANPFGDAYNDHTHDFCSWRCASDYAQAQFIGAAS